MTQTLRQQDVADKVKGTVKDKLQTLDQLAQNVAAVNGLNPLSECLISLVEKAVGNSGPDKWCHLP